MLGKTGCQEVTEIMKRSKHYNARQLFSDTRVVHFCGNKVDALRNDPQLHFVMEIKLRMHLKRTMNGNFIFVYFNNGYSLSVGWLIILIIGPQFVLILMSKLMFFIMCDTRLDVLIYVLLSVSKFPS